MVIGREQRRGGDAEARLLAFHVAARLQRARRLVDADAAERRIAALLRADVAERRRRRTATVIAASTAQPWRVSPTMRPKVKHSAAGIRKIDSISTKFESGVGFSYGCAELALKKPPPLVPSILIASCEATGPIASVCVVAGVSSVTGLPLASLSGWPSASSFGCCVGGGLERRHVLVGVEVLDHALAHQEHRERRSDSGSSMYSVDARRGRPRSCRWSCAVWRAKPRISAITTAMPVAAEKKFCTVSASICVR